MRIKHADWILLTSTGRMKKGLMNQAPAKYFVICLTTPVRAGQALRASHSIHSTLDALNTLHILYTLEALD